MGEVSHLAEALEEHGVEFDQFTKSLGQWANTLGLVGDYRLNKDNEIEVDMGEGFKYSVMNESNVESLLRGAEAMGLEQLALVLRAKVASSKPVQPKVVDYAGLHYRLNQGKLEVSFDGKRWVNSYFNDATREDLTGHFFDNAPEFVALIHEKLDGENDGQD